MNLGLEDLAIATVIILAAVAAIAGLPSSATGEFRRWILVFAVVAIALAIRSHFAVGMF